MTSPITSTSDANVIVALNLATDALATARQLAMPGAAEAAGALILGAFEGGVSADIDARLAVPIAYARGAAAWLVTEGIGVPWSPEVLRRCDRLATVLDTICAGFRTVRRRQHKPRRPSISKLVEQAKVAGATAITLPDGTKLDFTKATDATADDEVENWLRKQKGH